ncbi:class I SAM-dependent DNA methyltransferase [Elioraea sp.]|uniref:class I SAM-dependent DNA methyltransferase n=1 Tax=Elioraea sp. TaxID=2185103 RepID=UPI003F706BF4
MQPADFIAAWRTRDGTERQLAQAHFRDLCDLLGVAAPPDGEGYVFEYGLGKTTGARGWADVFRRGCFGWEYKRPGADLTPAYAQLQQYAPALDNPPLLIVSDCRRIELHTNWTNAVHEVHRFGLEDLADAAQRDRLKRAWTDPDFFRPGRTRAQATKEAADAFADLAARLATQGHPAPAIARFIDRWVFSLFADDIGLLPDGLVPRMLAASERFPDRFAENCAKLFAAMARPGGVIDFEPVPWFNGDLFADAEALPVGRDDIRLLRGIAALDWSQIDPAIFGTLFEHFLNPEKRGQIGAYYTDPRQIMQLVEPVVIRPLAAEWQAAREEIAALLGKAAKGAARTRAERRAGEVFGAFMERLRGYRVLDPACGSGNFLYLSLQALKDFERMVGIAAEALGLARPLAFAVGPESVRGIEKDPYAAELARLVVWIGEIQWNRRNGFDVARDPVLRPLPGIECRDALLTADGGEASWPAAEAIVGNPPFLGGQFIRRALGDADYATLRRVFGDRIAGSADLVTYWFEKARAQIASGKAKRAGLVATNSIGGQASRGVLDRIRDSGQTIFEAWSDEEWIVDSAAVRVSLICFGEPPSDAITLDGKPVTAINADLSGGGGDLTQARPLRENAGRCFQGSKKVGPFEVPGEQARDWLHLPANPNGRPNADVLRPSWIGIDLVRRPRDLWIIDFSGLTAEQAALYEAPFAHVLRHVKPLRDQNRDRQRRERWWLFGRSGADMRAAIAPLARFIATPEVAKHRVFRWVPAPVLPDCQLMVTARDDDTTFGILHSRFHEAWALRLGTWLGVGNDPRYTPTTTFETFPLPEGLTPDRPPDPSDPRAAAIAAAAQRLDALREAWLNPPDLVRRKPEVVPGFPDRLLPVSAEAAAVLKTRTLTNLYNARPQWLVDAHAALDAAVAAAYGWDAGVGEDEALARLLDLNRARAVPSP